MVVLNGLIKVFRKIDAGDGTLKSEGFVASLWDI